MVRDSGETIELLNELGLRYFVFSKPGKSKYHRIINLPFSLFKATFQHLKFRPDIIIGFGIYSAFSSIFLRKPCIVFRDTEPRISFLESIQYKIFMPFVDKIITPACFLDDLGSKQVRVNGFKELAYLHPDYYRPNEDIFSLLKLNRNDDYALIRFGDFNAAHDFGIRSFSPQDKIELIKILNKYTKVFVSFDGAIPEEIKEYELKTPKSRIHDVLYYAKLFICDTGTMATEAAILGTPVIRCSSFVGQKWGNFVELENKYDLMVNIRDPKMVIRKAEEMIQKPNLKKEWHDKKEKLLEEKCDITKFMVEFIENYPISV